MPLVKTGLERFLKSPPSWIFGYRLGLLSNAASVNNNFQHARKLIDMRFTGQLKALYSPQHGFFSEKQDNMIESKNIVDPILKIPVFSLYGNTRIPTREMFEPIDVLIIDLQDVGTRVYTYIYTMSYCLEAAQKFKKKVLVLDRPNPISGSATEGNCLSTEFTSFVGRYPIPMRHGLTIGELSLLFNNHYKIGCDLEVVPMKGWKRAMYFDETNLPWVPPSPNLPRPESAMVYPGQVLWEGTNVSEGRGTSQPFELFGAPFIDTEKIISALGKDKIPGIVLRPAAFEPTSNKWNKSLCKGFQIHITDRYKFKPYTTSLRLIQAVIKTHKKSFRWKNPPYEYEFKKMPIDLLIGSKKIRQSIEQFNALDEISESWFKDTNEFIKSSSSFHLYK